MGWQRTPPLITELPHNPSLLRWGLAGVMAIITGGLLFVLHASGRVAVFETLDIWWVSLTAPGAWLFLLCVRGWLLQRELDRHLFLQREAERAQQQWEDWSERYLAVLGSCVLLPDRLTAGCLYGNMPQAVGLARRISYLPHQPGVTELLLRSIEPSIQQLTNTLPLHVTLIVDDSSLRPIAAFTEAWKTIFPDRDLPDKISVTDTLPLHFAEARLSQPELTVDLILVMQQRGGEAYSDGLAALLLTSDDVAQKHHLSHTARLLRPMSLEISTLCTELALFLDTQTAARRTERVFCDSAGWYSHFADLLTTGAAYQTSWKVGEIAVLEKWVGIPGPASAWLLIALAADAVSISDAPILGLFSSGDERFISTLNSGSGNQ